MIGLNLIQEAEVCSILFLLIINDRRGMTLTGQKMSMECGG